MTLPIDPNLYDLQTIPLDPRAIPSPAPVMPPPPGLDQMQPEIAPFVPHQGPDPWTRLLSPFAQLPFGGAALLGRNAPPWMYLLLGLAAGAGRARAADYQRSEQNTSELNRRFGLAAAERNRINIEASKAADKERIQSAKEQSKAAAKKKEDEAQKAADKAARDAETKDLRENPYIGESATAINAGLVGRRYKTLTPQERAQFAREGTPRGANVGSVVPTLAARTTDLLEKAKQIRAANFNQPTAEADSLTTMANGLGLGHAALRMAQTPEEVDAINWPDTPPDVQREIAQAIRARKIDLGAKPPGKAPGANKR